MESEVDYKCSRYQYQLVWNAPFHNMSPEEFKNFLGATASFSTLIQFLAGSLVCVEIMKKRSTGDISPFPFLIGAVSTFLWFRYGCLIGDNNMIHVNTIGFILFFIYNLCYYSYSHKRIMFIRQMLCCFIFLSCCLLYVETHVKNSQIIAILGTICCSVTLVFFAAPLATFLHVIKVKNTDSLPAPIIVSNLFVSFQWFVYGLMIKDQFVQMPNLLGTLISTVLLSLYCFYPKGSKHQLNEVV